jgi:PRC-barrel domain
VHDAADKPADAGPRADQSAAEQPQNGVENPAASRSLDLERTTSESDQAGSDSDQTASDRDQAASDEDQAASDQESAAGSDQRARDAASVHRAHATQLREEDARARLRTAASRDSTADERDQVAAVRDPSAEPQDDSAESDQQDDAEWNVAEWHGRMLIDREGKKIGKLQDVYVDVETDEPQFATVKEGFIGRHLTFVPLGGIKVGPDVLEAAVSKAQVENAPNLEQHGEELSQADESSLYHHFELNYTPPAIESGRRLARR